LIERRMGGSRETKIGPLVAGQDIDRHTRSSDNDQWPRYHETSGSSKSSRRERRGSEMARALTASPIQRMS